MEFIKSVSLVGWLVIVTFVLFVWLCTRSPSGRSRLEEDMKTKQAKSASYVPPPPGG